MTKIENEANADAMALVTDIFSNSEIFVRAIISGRRRNMNPGSEKIEFRPVQLGSDLKIQKISTLGRKVTTENHIFGEVDVENIINCGYANLLIETTDRTLTIRYTKKGDLQVHEDRRQNHQTLSHDRKKIRLLNPDSAFLIRLGISDKNGLIKPSMNSKYLQIEEFLRVLTPLLEGEFNAGRVARPTADSPLILVDHGCGNAYLTFAVHLYLHEQNIFNRIIGIDLREDSRRRNQQVAEDLEISAHIKFVAEKIADSKIVSADVAIALHACDTATDDALAWALKDRSKIVLVSPCCHHDLQVQMTKVVEPWSILTKHGIIKQRLGDILTDSLRAQIMRLRGYRTDIIEFIGDEHTPRNLLIRCVFTDSPVDKDEQLKYQEMVKLWGFQPKLGELLGL